MTKDEIKATVGRNIRILRKGKSMEIEELAEILGLSSGFIGLVERGKRGVTPLTLHRLSEIFDVSIDSLFTNNVNESFKIVSASRLSKMPVTMSPSKKEVDIKNVINLIRAYRDSGECGLDELEEAILSGESEGFDNEDIYDYIYVETFGILPATLSYR